MNKYYSNEYYTKSKLSEIYLIPFSWRGELFLGTKGCTELKSLDTVAVFLLYANVKGTILES